MVLTVDTCFAFSAPPTSPDCIVVVWFPFDIHITSPGKTYWQSYVNTLDHHTIRPSLGFHLSLALYGKDLYFFSVEGKLGVVRMRGKYTYEYLINKPPESLSMFCGQRFLVECNNSLVSVLVGEFGKWAGVFKLNDSTRTWKKLDNLGKYMIYVCGTEAFSVIAKLPGMENKIYFPRSYGGNLAFYSFDTCKYHTFGNRAKGMKKSSHIY